MNNKRLDKKVSVIVPIFNAEHYLRECLESIINQTYKNTEIILVNDGSDDNSGEVASTFAKKDKRIRLLNQTNKGVSRARNRALDIATGAWVMFVDADDIVPEKSIEIMLSAAVDAKTHCVSGKFQSFSKNIDSRLVETTKNNCAKKMLNREDAINSLLYQVDIANAPFSKLYSRESISSIRFNKDISVAEDLLFNYNVIKNLNQVLLINDITYLYRNNPSSAINKTFSIKRMSGIKATGLILADIKNQDLPIAPAVNRHFMEALFILSQIKPKRDHLSCYNDCINVIINYRKHVFMDLKSPITYRIFALLSMINPATAICIYKTKVYAGSIASVKGL